MRRGQLAHLRDGHGVPTVYTVEVVKVCRNGSVTVRFVGGLLVVPAADLIPAEVPTRPGPWTMRTGLPAQRRRPRWLRRVVRRG